MNAALDRRANGQDFNCPAGNDWERYKQVTSDAVNKIIQTNDTMRDIKSQTKHLEALPQIAGSLRNLNRNNTLLLVLLAVILIVREVKDSKVNVKVPWLGIEITQGDK